MTTRVTEGARRERPPSFLTSRGLFPQISRNQLSEQRRSVILNRSVNIEHEIDL